MDFKLTEEHEMLKKTIRDFASKEIAPIAGEIDKSGEFPWECVKKLAQLGTFGLLVPPLYGGTGPDKLGFLIANEEISRASASVSIALIHSNVVSSLILMLGNDEQKAKFLPALAKGEKLGAFCVAESGSGANWPLTLQTTARADGVASAALDAAIDYVKQRAVIPGQTLANFDGVQCAIADMASMVEASRLLVYQAGCVTEPDPIPGLIAIIFPCEAALEVTNMALQALGRFGYTRDFPIERYFRDARGLLLVGQPVEMRKLMAGKLKLGISPLGPPGGAPPRRGGA